jgi:hypothetical protein
MMSRRPAQITQADVARVIRAAKQAGATEVKVRGPKNAEPVVKLLAEYKAEVLAVLAETTPAAKLRSPWFERVLPAVQGEPSIQVPCASRRGRVQRLEDAMVLHFCVECGAWGAFGYNVNLRLGRPGQWYCAAHRPQGAER